MKLKYIPYWFKALPFSYALRLTIYYLIKRIMINRASLYFSQTGEDIIISNLLTKEKGFFVDVGCHHPIHVSNTFALYLNG